MLNYLFVLCKTRFVKNFVIAIWPARSTVSCNDADTPKAALNSHLRMCPYNRQHKDKRKKEFVQKTEWHEFVLVDSYRNENLPMPQVFVFGVIAATPIRQKRICSIKRKSISLVEHAVVELQQLQATLLTLHVCCRSIQLALDFLARNGASDGVRVGRR